MIDLLHRIAYRMAYRLMRVYWALLRPRTHGALVAVWSDGQVLVVRTSYAPYHSFPGGYVRRGETAREAARRELREEVGLRVEASALEPFLETDQVFEGKRDRVEVFELRPAARPEVAPDRREVVEARFLTPEEALRLRLPPPVRWAIEQRARAPAGGR